MAVNPWYETVRPWHALDDSWMEDGACAGASAAERERYFWDINPDVRSKILVGRLKLRCNDECPVRDRCLAFALKADMHGVWGGTTRKERVRMTPKARRLALAVIAA